MEKKEIIKNLNNITERNWRNSMWVSESFYNPYFLMNAMFEENKIDMNSLTEKELNLIYETANYASEAFY